MRRLHILLTVLGVLGAGLTGAVVYATSMPGTSFSGATPVPTASSTVLAQRLRQHVERIASEEHNARRPEELARTLEYLEGAFRDLDLQPQRATFSAAGRPFHNLFVELPGNDPAAESTVVVGAHYDSALHCPGANDNGSGVAALLELTRLLASQERPQGVMLVAFANEEPPFFQREGMGSVAFVRFLKHQERSVSAMISLETMGYFSEEPGSQSYPAPLSWFYPSTGNFIGFVGNLNSRTLVRTAVGTFRENAVIQSEGVALPEWVSGVGWSDHWAFWEADVPALMVTDTAPFRYPHYHTAEDTPDKLDYRKLARVVEGLVPVIAELAAQP